MFELWIVVCIQVVFGHSAPSRSLEDEAEEIADQELDFRTGTEVNAIEKVKEKVEE